MPRQIVTTANAPSLTNPADSAGLNEEYARWFPTGPPTRYVAKPGVELTGLLVSIRMTAFTA